MVSDWSVEAEDDSFLWNWGDEDVYDALDARAAFAIAAKFLRDWRSSSGGGGGGGSYDEIYIIINLNSLTIMG